MLTLKIQLTTYTACVDSHRVYRFVSDTQSDSCVQSGGWINRQKEIWL